MINQSKGKRKQQIISWSVIAAMIVAGIVIAIVLLLNNAASKKQALYNKAVAMTMEGNWKDTIETFESLSKSNYKGAGDFYLYCKGKQQYAKGDLKTAYHTVGQTRLKDLTEEQRDFIMDYFFELSDEYHRKYGYDLPAGYKPSSSNNSSSSSSTENHSHSSGGNSTTTTDPYNAKDYVNEDVFYEDYYNDFIDFDEAEQYWDEHHK